MLLVAEGNFLNWAEFSAAQRAEGISETEISDAGTGNRYGGDGFADGGGYEGRPPFERCGNPGKGSGTGDGGE